MALVKCSRCELNYMNDTDKMCSVCRREVRGENEHFNVLELCSECGENPAATGQELCIFCLKELARHAAVSTDDTVEHEAASIKIDSVATMDEIELDIRGNMNDDGFEEEADFSEDDDEIDDDDDEDEDE